MQVETRTSLLQLSHTAPSKSHNSIIPGTS